MYFVYLPYILWHTLIRRERVLVVRTELDDFVEKEDWKNWKNHHRDWRVEGPGYGVEVGDLEKGKKDVVKDGLFSRRCSGNHRKWRSPRVIMWGLEPDVVRSTLVTSRRTKTERWSTQGETGVVGCVGVGWTGGWRYTSQWTSVSGHSSYNINGSTLDSTRDYYHHRHVCLSPFRSYLKPPPWLFWSTT